MKRKAKKLILSFILLTQFFSISTIHAEGNTLGEVIKDNVLKTCIIKNASGKNFNDNTPIEDISNYYKNTFDCGTTNGYIKDLTGIDQLTKAKTIQLIGHRVENLTPLKNMTQLTKIDLSNNYLGDEVLKTLAGANLPNLDTLYLSGNNLTDITPLTALTVLEGLNLDYNEIVDITPLKDMEDMRILSLVNNNINEITALSNMPNLYHLYLTNNNIQTLEPLRGSKKIGTIQFSYNEISDLSPLNENKNIFNILAIGNKITEIDSDLYDTIKNIKNFAYFNNQSINLKEAQVIKKTLTLDNPIKMNNDYLVLNNISNNGIQSADLSTITWTFTTDTIPSQVSFEFSQLLNENNSRPFSGTVFMTVEEYFNINFISNGGTAIDSQTVKKDSKIIEPGIPLKEGYEFNGWYMDDEYTTAWNFNSDPVTKDVTLYAKWRAEETYIFNFDMQGHGSQVPQQIVAENTTPTKPANLSETGYTFKGWYTDTTFTTEYDFTKVITKNTTVYAKWEVVIQPEKEYYTLSFDMQGYGVAIVAQTVIENTAGTKPVDPSEDGYKFEGWYTDTAFIVEYDFTTSLTKDVIVYAKWTKKTIEKPSIIPPTPSDSTPPINPSTPTTPQVTKPSSPSTSDTTNQAQLVMMVGFAAIILKVYVFHKKSRNKNN